MGCIAILIAFIGMDDSLIAYDAKELYVAMCETECLYEAQIRCEQGGIVTTHKTYIDSGGW